MQDRGVVDLAHGVRDALQGEPELPVGNPHGDVAGMHQFALTALGQKLGDRDPIGRGDMADDGVEDGGHGENLWPGWNP
jgi:hypothetical protein